MTEEIAKTEIVAIAPDGERDKIIVRVCRPEKMEDHATCAVSVEGLGKYDRLPLVHGNDPFQALALGIYALRMLFIDLKRRGWHFSFGDRDSEVDPVEIWFEPKKL